MFDLGYNVLMAVKVILTFTLFYIFIPAQIIRFQEEADHFLDKIFISLTHATFFTIIIVHLLAFLKLYETLSLIFCSLAAYILLAWLRGQSPTAVADAMGMKLVINLLDMSEGRTGFGGAIKKLLSGWVKQQKDNTIQLLKKIFADPFSSLLPIGVFIAAAYVRFKHSIVHAAYPVSDAYVHLAWTKYLGNNQIYHDGIYSYGYHAIISALNKLSFIDPYWLCRFLGPFGGILLVLSVYYFALRVTQNHTASFIALVIFGLVTDNKFPMLISRQTAALPQEYAAIFMLPGLYFLWLYLQSQRNPFLLLYAETLALTILIHPFATVYFIIWSSVLILSAFLLKKLSYKTIFNVTVYSIFSTAISLLPFGIGLLMGKGFFASSTKHIQENIFSPKITGNLIDPAPVKLVTHNPFFDFALPIALFLMLAFRVLRKRNQAVTLTTISACSIILYLLYRAPELGLPEITAPFRTGVFLAPMFAILYASGFHVIEKCIPGSSINTLQTFKNMLLKAVALTLCLMVICFYYVPDKLPVEALEYDAAAENYLSIKNRYPTLDWTIVAPAEQYQQVMGSGWHYEILRFVQNFSLEQAKDPQFEIPIPTHHIFFYTEKRPLDLGREVTTEDAQKELEPEGSDPFAQYYHTTDQRAILEAKAIRWIEAYMKSHQHVSVFYEDVNMKIYHIYHEPKRIEQPLGEAR